MKLEKNVAVCPTCFILEVILTENRIVRKLSFNILHFENSRRQCLLYKRRWQRRLPSETKKRILQWTFAKQPIRPAKQHHRNPTKYSGKCFLLALLHYSHFILSLYCVCILNGPFSLILFKLFFGNMQKNVNLVSFRFVKPNDFTSSIYLILFCSFVFWYKYSHLFSLYGCPYFSRVAMCCRVLSFSSGRKFYNKNLLCIKLLEYVGFDFQFQWITTLKITGTSIRICQLKAFMRKTTPKSASSPSSEHRVYFEITECNECDHILRITMWKCQKSPSPTSTNHQT